LNKKAMWFNDNFFTLTFSFQMMVDQNQVN